MDKNTCKSEPLPVSLTEEMVMNTAYMPRGMKTWRYFRIEYGGCNESCIKELPIYLPPNADAYVIDLLFDFWQAENKVEMAEKAAEIAGILKGQIGRKHDTP
jgi:hypothetical protein